MANIPSRFVLSAVLGPLRISHGSMKAMPNMPRKNTASRTCSSTVTARTAVMLIVKVKPDRVIQKAAWIGGGRVAIRAEAKDDNRIQLYRRERPDLPPVPRSLALLMARQERLFCF